LKDEDVGMEDSSANTVKAVPLQETIKYLSTSNGSKLLFPVSIPNYLQQPPVKYPNPKLICASCGQNPYTYRDSTSKLPICSLECYKKIHAK